MNMFIAISYLLLRQDI